MIYLDTSALVKLVFEEQESEALVRWLDQRTDEPKVSAEMATIELLRVCRRHDETAQSVARGLLAGLDLVPLSADVTERAALADPTALRTLDAIHLASAWSLADNVSAFVAYDRRLASAATGLGMHVASPA